jgi:Protein of unknown function (DUF2459)
MYKWIVLSLLALGATGCVSVYPQKVAVVPTVVYVTDYGIHSSVIIPNGDGRYVEYAFGDWYYAALNHDWPNDAMGALLISFKSGLGRRFIEADPEDLKPTPSHPAPERMQVLHVSREEVENVRRELDARYQRDLAKGNGKVVHNPENQMDFVPDDEHYSFYNNCNDLTARCLRQMGCELVGVVGFSKFHVVKVKQEFVEEPALASKKGGMPTAIAN